MVERVNTNANLASALKLVHRIGLALLEVRESLRDHILGDELAALGHDALEAAALLRELIDRGEEHD